MKGSGNKNESLLIIQKSQTYTHKANLKILPSSIYVELCGMMQGLNCVCPQIHILKPQPPMQLYLEMGGN